MAVLIYLLELRFKNLLEVEQEFTKPTQGTELQQVYWGCSAQRIPRPPSIEPRSMLRRL